IGGPLTIERTSAGTAISTLVLGNSTLTASNFDVRGVTSGVSEAIFRNEVPGNTVSFSGNFSIGIGGLVDLQGAGVGGNVFISGNYQNDGPTQATLSEFWSTITFDGAGAQGISTAGFQDVFDGFRLAKSGDDVTLNDPLAVSGV